jgi:8-oxo-dGTP diphosphatase
MMVGQPQYPRVGVAMIVHRGDQVLLVRRINAHGAGTWSTPGGHLEYGETLEECAARETMEETHVSVREVRFKAVTNDIFAQEGLHYVTVWMEGEYAGGEPQGQAEELSELGWFNWDALPAPLFLPLHNLLSGQNRLRP